MAMQENTYSKISEHTHAQYENIPANFIVSSAFKHTQNMCVRTVFVTNRMVVFDEMVGTLGQAYYT